MFRTLFPLVSLLGACAPLDAAPGPDLFQAQSPVEEAFPGARVTAEGTMELATGPDSSVVIPYVVQEGLAVAGGDMILGEPHRLGQRGAGVHTEDKLWSCEIPYEIGPNLSSTSIENFRSAVDHWEEQTPLRFVEDPTATDRILVRDGSGCSAFVGKMGGAQHLTLKSTCNRGSAIHELGHALGLWHEQSRLDAPEHVTVHWDRIEPRYQFAFRTWEQRGYVGIDVGEYDIGSVMHYGSWSFKTGGRCSALDTSGCTITTVDGGYIRAQRDGLSPSDLQTVETLYAACYGEPPPPVERPVVTLPWDSSTSFEVQTDVPSALSFTLDEDREVRIDIGLFLLGELEPFELGQAGVMWDQATENPFSGSHVWVGWLAAGTYEIRVQGSGSPDAWLGPARVHGYLDDPNDAEWTAVMELVNSGDLELLDVQVGLDRRAAEAITERWFGVYDLRDLDTLSYVGPTAFDALYDYVRQE